MTPLSMSFLPLILGSILVLGSIAWLSSSSSRVARTWAEHPWRVYWLALLVGILGLTLIGSGFRWVGSLLSAVGLVVVIVSAAQGLRVTWHRSHGRAVLISLLIVAAFLSGPVNSFSRNGNTEELDF